MAKLESYPSMLITLVQKHHDIYIRRIVCNTSFENGHMHWLGGDASVNGGGKSGRAEIPAVIQLGESESGLFRASLLACWCENVWKKSLCNLVDHLQVWAQWVWVTWPATCVPLCRCKQPLASFFFELSQPFFCTKIIDDPIDTWFAASKSEIPFFT